MTHPRVSSPITFGRCLLEVEVAGITITETEHQPRYRLDFHHHEHPNVAFLISGSHIETFRFREIECLPGAIVVKPSGALHAYSYGAAGSRSVILEFRKQCFARTQWSDCLDEVRSFEGGLPSTYAWQIVLEARGQPTGWKLRIEELLILLSAEIALRKSIDETRHPNWLRNVRDFLEGSYQGELTLADVAGIGGVHPVYLTRAFRARFGCTVAQFVRRKRLDHAIRELTSTSKSVARIASECGFCDQSHLTNLLRKATGLPPATLRRTYLH